MHLDQRRQAQRTRGRKERDQGVLLERRHDEQGDVRAVGTCFPELVVADHEVLAQHRDGHSRSHRGQVGERTAEAALLGEHADDVGAARRIVGSESRRVSDRGERPLAGALTLDLGDDRHTGGAQRRLGVEGRRSRRDLGGKCLEARQLLTCSEVGAHAREDVVEHRH